MPSLNARAYCVANWKPEFPSLPYCGANQFFEFLSLALLRCKLTFKISDLGRIVVQTEFQNLGANRLDLIAVHQCAYFNYLKPFLHNLQRIFREHWGGETFRTFLSWVESERMSNYAPFAPDIPNQPEKLKIVIDKSFFIAYRWRFHTFFKTATSQMISLW